MRVAAGKFGLIGAKSDSGPNSYVGEPVRPAPERTMRQGGRVFGCRDVRGAGLWPYGRREGAGAHRTDAESRAGATVWVWDVRSSRYCSA